MNPAFESPSRATRPPGPQQWLTTRAATRQEKEDRLIYGKAQWLESVERSRKAFEEHVYNNQEFDWLDALQHRSSLLDRLSEADKLKLEYFEVYGIGDQANAFLLEIEAIARDLLKEFLEWHLPPDFKDPVPDSFKRGMNEAKTGNVVDFPSGAI